MASQRFAVQIEGRDLEVSNLDKVMYPAVGFTKGEVIDYYVRVAPVLLPHLAGRPVTFTKVETDEDITYRVTGQVDLTQGLGTFAEITTVEGLANEDGSLSPVQQAMQDNHGLQCGNPPERPDCTARQGLEGLTGRPAALRASDCRSRAAGHRSWSRSGCPRGSPCRGASS